MQITKLDRRSFAFKAGWSKYKVIADHVWESNAITTVLHNQFNRGGNIWSHTRVSSFKWQHYQWYIKQGTKDQILLRTDEQATIIALMVPETKIEDHMIWN
jgi:hypothetical protein